VTVIIFVRYPSVCDSNHVNNCYRSSTRWRVVWKLRHSYGERRSVCSLSRTTILQIVQTPSIELLFQRVQRLPGICILISLFRS